jgi:hypothetical protein
MEDVVPAFNPTTVDVSDRLLTYPEAPRPCTVDTTPIPPTLLK